MNDRNKGPYTLRENHLLVVFPAQFGRPAKPLSPSNLEMLFLQLVCQCNSVCVCIIPWFFFDQHLIYCGKFENGYNNGWIWICTRSSWTALGHPSRKKMARASAIDDVSCPAKSRLSKRSRICSFERLDCFSAHPRRSSSSTLEFSLLIFWSLSSIFLSITPSMDARDYKKKRQLHGVILISMKANIFN